MAPLLNAGAVGAPMERILVIRGNLFESQRKPAAWLLKLMAPLAGASGTPYSCDWSCCMQLQALGTSILVTQGNPRSHALLWIDGAQHPSRNLPSDTKSQWKAAHCLRNPLVALIVPHGMTEAVVAWERIRDALAAMMPPTLVTQGIPQGIRLYPRCQGGGMKCAR